MKKLGETWQCTLEVLSPLHIGCGETLGPLDYVTWKTSEGIKIQVLDLAGLVQARNAQGAPIDLENLARLMEQPGFDRELLRQRFQITSEQIGQATRYVLQQNLPDVRKRNEVRAHIRDVRERAYVPGTSLKGAIRTALLYHLAPEDTGRIRELATPEPGRRMRPEEAAGRLEKLAFGKSPNHDLMRVLQVSDSQSFRCQGPIRYDEFLLQADRVAVEGPEHEVGMTQWIEAIRPGAKTTLTIHYDTWLYSRQAEPELQFNRHREHIDQLFARCNAFARALLKEQQRMLEAAEEHEAAHWCAQMLAQTETEEHALLSVGWGQGWLGTTIGLLFDPDDPNFHALAAQYQLARNQKRPEYYRGHEFPGTLWVVRSGGRRYPPGWVKLTRQIV
ncbi:MAG: type III-A CRISPR-associated RAMP protein Csm5 [Chloroherpetonaceae bacterium]|nr:type III-A CRISPR-associated RAMP protein Csm5 [Chthonomonadaceae bacterium]MDW8209108.1 type III-A CRISPR-associated RAMP protein Csm5 [Chloroherpetonaceae bacterium]